MRGFIIRRDHSLMHRVNSWEAPRWMRAYVIASTRAGDGWLWYAMGIVILLFGGDARFRALGSAAPWREGARRLAAAAPGPSRLRPRSRALGQ